MSDARDGHGDHASVPFSGMRSFAAGALSGAVAKTAVAPFDRTKILMQVSRMYGWNAYAGGVGQTMTTIWRTEGVRGFFRGNSATVARIMPYSAIQYSAFEMYNRNLAQYVFHPESTSPLKRFVAGSLAGTTSVVCTYPIDLARTVLAVQVGSADPAAPRPSLFRTLGHIVRTEGAGGLYRGAYPTIVGVVPYSGISFLSYGVLKKRADASSVMENRPVLSSLVCGGSAGLTAQCCTYPLDMVRRRLQALHAPDKMTAQEREFLRVSQQGLQNRLVQFSIIRAIGFILRTEGLAGLYRGVSLNFLKTAPAMSISFTCYDWMRTLLGVPSGKYSATSG